MKVFRFLLYATFFVLSFLPCLLIFYLKKIIFRWLIWPRNIFMNLLRLYWLWLNILHRQNGQIPRIFWRSISGFFFISFLILFSFSWLGHYKCLFFRQIRIFIEHLAIIKIIAVISLFNNFVINFLCTFKKLILQINSFRLLSRHSRPFYLQILLEIWSAVFCIVLFDWWTDYFFSYLINLVFI